MMAEEELPGGTLPRAGRRLGLPVMLDIPAIAGMQAGNSGGNRLIWFWNSKLGAHAKVMSVTVGRRK